MVQRRNGRFKAIKDNLRDVNEAMMKVWTGEETTISDVEGSVETDSDLEGA